MVNTRDNLIDTVERTIEDDGEGDTAESEAIKETEEDNGIVIEVSVDDEYFNDNDCFYYEEDESVKARRRQQQLEEQKRKATALQNYKKELSLKTRAYLATNVLPLLNKTKEFGASTNKTTDNDNTNAWSK